MPLETLIATLAGEADAEAAGELARARAEADAIAAAAAERIGRRRAAVLDTLERERRTEVERRLLHPRREARRLVLEARHALVQRVFAAARNRLSEALDSAAYRTTLQGRLEEALACVGDRPVTLRSYPRLTGEIERLIAQRARVVEDPAVGAGFKAVTDDGTLEVDGTLEARLHGLAAVLSLEIVGRIEQAT
ncbi:MAG: hypothetical protein HY700_19500 [Gemmatimonadetes bacterium]|nr:hypothetical protein [Gemmatimonadota bacterium]